MVVLLAALGVQVPAPGPCSRGAAAGTALEAGWRAYRAGDAADAMRRFSLADSLCPGEHGAQVGLGFALFRLGRAEEAAGRFLLALRSDSADADAWYGLGLARARSGWCTACGPSRRPVTITTRCRGRRNSARRCGAWWTWCMGGRGSGRAPGTRLAATTPTSRITCWRI